MLSSAGEQWLRRLVPLGRRRGLGLPLNLPPTPGPLPFDFHAKRDAQECSDQDYNRKHAEVAECRSDRNCPNDISSDQEFKPQQDAASEISSVRWKNGRPIPLGNQRTREPHRRGNCDKQNGRNARNLESRGNPMRSGVESRASRRVRSYSRLVRTCSCRGERSKDHRQRSRSKMSQMQPCLLSPFQELSDDWS
jgi:hypothetical protein